MTLQTISRALSDRLGALAFSAPTTHVYNPLEYAWQPHSRYLERYGRGDVEVLFVGMNPGPFGMGQTGVPFGDPTMVRTFLGIEGAVGHPPCEHPKRPVLGFDCRRAEVSGTRVWTWVQGRFETPERFFARRFIYNYCPLLFMEASGRNRTPDKLPVAEREPLLAACDDALLEVVDLLEPAWVIGVGAWAAKRASVALDGRDVRVGTVLHPSPASPKANRGWAEQADAELRAQGVPMT